jgi:histone deacetylase HOS3
MLWERREEGGTEEDDGTRGQRNMAWTPYAPDTAIYFQDECYKHKYIRSNNISTIVERPERLRALKIGVGAAIARLEAARDASIAGLHKRQDIGEELSTALGKLSLSSAQQEASGAHDSFAMRPIDVIAIVKPDLNLKDLTQHPAVRMVHAATDDGKNDALEHLNRLATWARESDDKIRSGESEIPTVFPQGDLYSETFFLRVPSNLPAKYANKAHSLRMDPVHRSVPKFNALTALFVLPVCPQSYSAICGAVQTVCDAVDGVVTASRSQHLSHCPQPESQAHASPAATRAFVAIRPPGHHCGEDTPSGFCFVNNVAIGAAHGKFHPAVRSPEGYETIEHRLAYLQHSISRVIILDIDLHHGKFS